MDIIATLTSEFGLQKWQVENTVNLIDEGNTIPFIARYRKEAHGSLDDQVLRELNDRLTYLRNLDKRREEILGSIEEQGKLTEELKAKIDAATVLAELEDLYRPYKQKRRTRAMMAGAQDRRGDSRRSGCPVCRCREGRRDGGGRTAGRVGHYRGAHLR